MSASWSVEVLVVSPGAGVRLATVDGRRVVRFEVVEDARATLAALNVTLAASDGRPTRSTRSTPAWREHRITGPVAGRAPGVDVRDGRLVVDLQSGVDLSAFRRELLRGLGRVATGAASATVEERLRLTSGGGGRGWPRRPPSDAASAPRSHLLNLGREAWLPHWIAVAARLAAIAAEAS